ncbi:GTPase Era [Paracoccaceae bacterium]|nr:GTPase Era [Paracoccaceae bacterium]
MSDHKKKLLKALIIGKPNVGKSTLINFLVGEKVSIISRKAQTTQKNTTGVVTRNDIQLIFFDTPGLNRVEKNVRISETFLAVAENIDVVIYMVDNRKKSQSIDHQFSTWLKDNDGTIKKKILLVNKIDCIEKVNLLEITKKINEIINFDETFFISVTKESGTENFIKWIDKQAYSNEWLFDKNYKSNVGKNKFLSELTREKIFEYIHEEIPYNLEIKTDYIEPSSKKSMKVYQTVWLNKKSYKPIILGKQGKAIKMISLHARQEMERFLNCKVHLFIKLKVKKSS